MTIIEDANKYLHEKPTAFRTKDRKLEKAAVLIEKLVKEIERRDKVIEAAKEFIDTNVSDWKAQDVAYDKFSEALSQLEEDV